MAKLRSKKELPHIFTEKMEHFTEVENYIKHLETENMILKMMTPSELFDISGITDDDF